MARHQWTEAEKRLLGTMTDAEVAARIGISVNSVQLKRRALKIAPRGADKSHPRPAAPEDARTERLQVRLSPAELAGLEAAAAGIGKTSTDLVRNLILALL